MVWMLGAMVWMLGAMVWMLGATMTKPRSRSRFRLLRRAARHAGSLADRFFLRSAQRCNKSHGPVMLCSVARIKNRLTASKS